MKVHVWGINYGPEVTGISPYNVALCEFLHARGHEVRMVTTFCYYPAWKKLPEDRGKLYRTDQIRGVPVHRCWHYVPARVTTLRRVAHELTFVATSLIRQLTLPRPDLWVVVSPPLLLGMAAWALSRIKGAPFIFHVQDLQPDAAAGLGMIKPGPLLQALRFLERFAYAKAARVGGISQGMMRAFEEKGVDATRRLYFPNGVALPDPATAPRRGAFREREGFQPGDFLAVYSGNLGVKQGLEVLVEAARRLSNPKVKIILCGDGAVRGALERQAAEARLGNLRLLPLQPEAAYHEMLADADLWVIPQQAGVGAFFFPSKLLGAVARGRPVLSVADPESELARAAATGGFGVNVPPGDPAGVAAALERLAASPEELRAMGRQGLLFARQFEQTAVLEKFLEEISRVCGTGQPKR